MADSRLGWSLVSIPRNRPLQKADKYGRGDLVGLLVDGM